MMISMKQKGRNPPKSKIMVGFEEIGERESMKEENR